MMRSLTLQVRVTWEADDVERFTKEALETGVDTIVAAGGAWKLQEIAWCLHLMQACMRRCFLPMTCRRLVC